MIVKSFEKKVNRLSDEFKGKMVMLSCNVHMTRNGQREREDGYDVTVFCEEFNENLQVHLEHPVPKEVTPLSPIDFEDVTLTFKGAYGGALPNGGGHYARLRIDIQAERAVVGHPAVTSTQPQQQNNAGQAGQKK